MIMYANKKKDRKFTFKKRNKVYLLRWNVKIKRSSNKLNYMKLESFEILEEKKLINYKLNFLTFMRIFSIFNISYFSFEICKLEYINSSKIFKNWFRESECWIWSRKLLQTCLNQSEFRFNSNQFD